MADRLFRILFADDIVTVSETKAGADPSNIGYLTFVDLKNQSRSITTLVAATQSTATLTGGGRDAERVNAMRVSHEYFDLLGITPALGRTFTASEDQPGAARRVVILSDEVWQRRFGADPAAIDRTIDISGIPFRIIGVLPRGFKDLVATRMYQGAEVWYSLGYDPAASFACRSCRHLRVFGRLAPGVTPDRASEELKGLTAGIERPFGWSRPKAPRRFPDWLTWHSAAKPCWPPACSHSSVDSSSG